MLNTNGGKPAYQWSLDPYHRGIFLLGRPSDFDVLPGGLNLDRATGLISGIPKVRGTFTFEVSVTAKRGSYGATRMFTIVIS
jgi:hypothetical protein